jgi:hypothetical protein
MSPFARRGRDLDRRQALNDRRPSTGLLPRVLVPGLAQMYWGQRDRGMIFLISFVSSLATSLFCWGDRLGWVFLGFVFFTHLTASLDVLRQRSFPVFPQMLASAATIGGVGLTVYLPLGSLLSLYAAPARSDGPGGVGYLVNRLAYRANEPSPGQWIWLRPTPSSSPRAGRVLAVGGDEVEWTGRRWRVGGKELSPNQAGDFPFYPTSCRFRVPDHHLLIGPEPDAGNLLPSQPLLIVGTDQIVGRAWARYYPFWDRCLL